MFEEFIKAVAENREQKTLACADIDAKIAELQLERTKIAEPFDKTELDLLTEYAPNVFAHGKSEKTEWGRIKFTRASTRRCWNLDALDSICAADPIVREKIYPFREEKEVLARFDVITK